MPHIDAQIVVAFDMRRSPYVAQQLAVREHASGMAHQGCEQSVFKRRQMNRFAIAAHLAQGQIHFDRAENARPGVSAAPPWLRRRKCARMRAISSDTPNGLDK